MVSVVEEDADEDKWISGRDSWTEVSIISPCR